MEQKQSPMKEAIHWVSSDDSLEFAYFSWCLTHSSIIALDAEWKPVRTRQLSFPSVLLLQIACRIANCDSDTGSPVFLVDLSCLHFLPSVYQLLNQALVSPTILKLGFRFKQDFVYLSSTFSSNGCHPGFEKVEPFIDAVSLYNYLLQPKESVGNQVLSKQTKSLAFICNQLLGIQLSKELQCSDWSLRPLSQEQKEYAAADAQCLLVIFDVFKGRTQEEGQPLIEATDSEMLLGSINQMDAHLKHVIRKYGDKILLKDTDRKPKGPKIHKKKERKYEAGMAQKQKQPAITDDWQGPPPWDLSLESDRRPKFLCDVMVEGLAKHLRCVGIDAAIPHTKKPDARDLIEHAYKEKRVILTRDSKLLKHSYLIQNQIYRVKTLLKNEQLLEVIETFQLKICEDQLMSRCTKCNGKFIQKPLTTEEAVEAAKGFQVIPNCLFNKNLEFWQCMDCNQLYWEGTQYHNALQKFIDVCKLSQ